MDETKEYLSEADIKQILENIPINSMDDVAWFFSDLHEYTPNLEKERIIEKMLPVIKSKKDSKKLRDHLSLSFFEYRRILKAIRIKIRNASDGKDNGRMASRLKCLRDRCCAAFSWIVPEK